MASARFLQTAAGRSLPLVAAASWAAIQHQNHQRGIGAQCDAPAFRTAVCTKNEGHTHDTRLVTLKLPSSFWSAEETVLPVVNVVVRAEVEATDDEGDGSEDAPVEKKKVARPYNPLVAPLGDEVTLLVKRYGEDAQVGSVLHELCVGEAVDVKGLNRQWTVPAPGAVREYAMIAGGTGITPIVQAIEGILATDPDAKVTVVTFNKSLGDILLARRLLELSLQHLDRFKFRHFVASGPPRLEQLARRSLFESPLLDLVEEKDPKAALLLRQKLALAPGVFERRPMTVLAKEPTKDILEGLLPKPTDHDGKVMVCVCGRPEMTAKVAGPKTKDYKQGEVGGILKELGFTEGQVWKF